MEKVRLQVLYSGRVQGVGFRYNVKSVSRGFEIQGTVRNLADGRVELLAEGARDELAAFAQAIRESGVGALIHKEEPHWLKSEGNFRGFEIVG